MMPLWRKVGQDILIGDGVTEVLVRVLATKGRGKKVRLGVVAPPGVSVDRKEVRDRKLASYCTPSPDNVHFDLGGEG